MEIFAKGVPRPVVLSTAVAAFCVSPARLLARGPNICLWRLFLHIGSCPACGSTRALAAFFHGQFAQAMAFNRNVVVTGPLILVLLGFDLIRIMQKLRIQRLTAVVRRRGHAVW